MTTILDPLVPKVRFAPSPTGLLHVGNARTALVNWLFTQSRKGKFLLRIDDTDLERSRPDYEKAIERDLAWLGIDWDEKFNQSERDERYRRLADHLRAEGRLYPCYETAEELDYKRKRLLAKHLPPLYDRAALSLTKDQIFRYEQEGRKPHWRFKLNEGLIAWDDLVRGPCSWQASHLSDPVLIRADGTVLYTLPSVIDDSDFEITHIIRGEDHVTNTATQIQLFEALGAAIPLFAHLPLLSDKEGLGLSKRLGSLSIEELREKELEPFAIVTLLSTLGTSLDSHSTFDQESLIGQFSFDHFSRSTPKFDEQDLYPINARLLQQMNFSEAHSRLSKSGLDLSEAFWLAIRPNLTVITEVFDWYPLCYERMSFPIDPTDQEFLRLACEVLPPEPWDLETWSVWIKEITVRTGRKGRELFHPLRLALTGRDKGPELKNLLPLIGRDKTISRLSGGLS
jgi:glutamyl-tRNA synthetase